MTTTTITTEDDDKKSKSRSKSILPSPEYVRLVTIIAHVDHGKTTLADNLVESNGIISERHAGTLRYLDFMEDEQRRGITMRTSAIGLKHCYVPPKQQQQQVPEDIVVHLMDSPGHVDFSMEVTSSLQVCDGAILVVDAVEGMCARTQSLLREAHIHQLVPILVINKLDRLCTELRLSETEAYLRLRNLVESVNAAAAAMLNVSTTQTDTTTNNNNNNNDNDNNHNTNGDSRDEEYKKVWEFIPSKGNVIFASALYGWGFTIPALARSLFRSKTLPLKPPMLRQYLFHDCSYNDHTQKILKWKHTNTTNNHNILPMFAEYALKPIWDIYQGVATATTSLGIPSELFSDYYHPPTPTTNNNSNNGSKSKSGSCLIQVTTPGMDVVLQTLKVGSTTTASSSTLVLGEQQQLQHLLTKTGAGSSEVSTLRAILRRYRPLSHAVLDAVYEHCPSPVQASSTIRSRALSLTTPTNMKNEEEEEYQSICHAVQHCHPSSNVPTVAHVCKFMATDRSTIHDPNFPHTSNDKSEGEDDNNNNNNNNQTNNNNNTNIIMGLARVLSGCLESSSSNDDDDDEEVYDYYCLGPKYNNSSSSTGTPIIPKRTIRLYLLMGSSFVSVSHVPAGHICAIYGLDDLNLKAVTLSNNIHCMPLSHGLYYSSIRPLVKVNVEAVSASDTDVLERGLVQLSLADAAVEVTATSKGERILACLGEIHLEQSIKDLQTIHCGGGNSGIQLRISDPIVEFGESTTWFIDDTTNNNNNNNNECKDYESFYNDSTSNNKSSNITTKLRQTITPPYCYEEGLIHAKRGRSRGMTSKRGASLHVRVIPLCDEVYQCLQRRQLITHTESETKHLLQVGYALRCFVASNNNNNNNNDNPELVLQELIKAVCIVDSNGNALMESAGVRSGHCIVGVHSHTGEIYVPPEGGDDTDTNNNNNNNNERNPSSSSITDDNNSMENNGYTEFMDIQSRIGQSGVGTDFLYPDDEEGNEEEKKKNRYANHFWKSYMHGSAVAGFQMAMRAGPLCEEPVRGVLVILEGVEIAIQPNNNSNNKQNTTTGDYDDYVNASEITGGMVVSALRSGIRTALLTRPVRLLEGHLRLTLHSNLSGLGPLYAVLSRRRGKVISDTMVEGTDLLLIAATIPQAESFGLAPELLKKSSGEVTAPELVFSHWDMLEEDPFWIPTSLEEREDFGEIVMNGDSSTGLDNHALQYIRMVRARKGLLVDSQKIVVAAEKQRTLSRKK